MKTVRTICFVAAGFYGLQALQFLFMPEWFRYVGRMSGASELASIQEALFSAQIAIVPYLVAGIFIFLLMAWQYKKIWNFIPWITILIMAAAFWWMFEVGGRGKQDDGSFLNMPQEAYRVLKIVQTFSASLQVVFLMLPPLLILIFWFRARNQIIKAELIAQRADIRY